MEITVYQISKDSLSPYIKSDAISNTNVIRFIESEENPGSIVTIYNHINFAQFWDSIMKRVNLLLPHFSTYTHTSAFLIPCHLLGSHETCDGFAYISKEPIIVATTLTDTLSVLCHELCHIFLYDIMQRNNLHSENIENITEFIELTICNDYLPKYFLPSKKEVLALFYQYLENNIGLEQYIIRICQTNQ